MYQNNLEYNNLLSKSGDKSKGCYKEKTTCIAHAHTEIVKSMKFSHNVYISTSWLLQQIVFKSKITGLRYLVVHLKRDPLYIVEFWVQFTRILPASMVVLTVKHPMFSIRSLIINTKSSTYLQCL